MFRDPAGVPMVTIWNAKTGQQQLSPTSLTDSQDQTYVLLSRYEDGFSDGGDPTVLTLITSKCLSASAHVAAFVTSVDGLKLIASLMPPEFEYPTRRSHEVPPYFQILFSVTWSTAGIEWFEAACGPKQGIEMPLRVQVIDCRVYDREDVRD
jgi:hypothetical protein